MKRSVPQEKKDASKIQSKKVSKLSESDAPLIRAKDIQLIDVKTIRKNPRNTNTHPKDQLDRLTKIIKYQGFRDPLVVSNQSGHLVEGHGRLDVAIRLNMSKVPVIYQDYDTPEMEFAAMTASNEIARWATLDMNVLLEGLDDLPDLDHEMLGMRSLDINGEEEGLTDEDEVPEVVHPITVLGDVWILGEHRLMCGDSTMIDDVEKLMNGEKADMVFTDPPYGMFLKTDFSSMDGLSPAGKPFLGTKGGKIHKKVKGDNEDFNPEFISNIFACFDYCKEVFLWGADYYSEHLIDKNGGAWIVWDKRTNEGTDDDKALSSDRAFGSSFELCWSKAKHKREIARIRNGVFGVKNESGNSKTLHPTQKPVQLVEWFFDKWGERSRLIVDLFLGSGSTMIASEKMGRKCFGMELDEKYCDVIIQRWQNFTGKKAIHENGVSYEDLKFDRDLER